MKQSLVIFQNFIILFLQLYFFVSSKSLEDPKRWCWAGVLSYLQCGEKRDCQNGNVNDIGIKCPKVAEFDFHALLQLLEKGAKPKAMTWSKRRRYYPLPDIPENKPLLQQKLQKILKNAFHRFLGCSITPNFVSILIKRANNRLSQGDTIRIVEGIFKKYRTITPTEILLQKNKNKQKIRSLLAYLKVLTNNLNNALTLGSKDMIDKARMEKFEVLRELQNLNYIIKGHGRLGLELLRLEVLYKAKNIYMQSEIDLKNALMLNDQDKINDYTFRRDHAKRILQYVESDANYYLISLKRQAIQIAKRELLRAQNDYRLARLFHNIRQKNNAQMRINEAYLLFQESRPQYIQKRLAWWRITLNKLNIQENKKTEEKSSYSNERCEVITFSGMFLDFLEFIINFP